MPTTSDNLAFQKKEKEVMRIGANMLRFAEQEDWVGGSSGSVEKSDSEYILKVEPTGCFDELDVKGKEPRMIPESEA